MNIFHSDVRLVLASASPRRRQLLEEAGLSFTVEPSKSDDERYPSDLPHFEIPQYLSRRKSETFHRALAPDELLITADTLVFLDDQVLGKPSSDEDARRMLKTLSDRTHQVLTGVTLRTTAKTVSLTDRSDVTFYPLSDDAIAYYVSHCNPCDKAGAYGIQDWIGLTHVSAVSGSYFNVMGLPVHRIWQELSRW